MLTNKEFMRLICERGGIVCVQNDMTVKNLCQIAPNGTDDSVSDIKDREVKIKFMLDEIFINARLKSFARVITAIPSTKTEKVTDEGIFKMFMTSNNTIIWIYICAKNGIEDDISDVNSYISAVNVNIRKHANNSEDMWTDISSGLIKCKEFKGEIKIKKDLDMDKQRLINSTGDIDPEVHLKRITILEKKLSELDLDRQNKIFNILDSLLEL